MIVGDIKGYFENVSHSVLANVLSKTIRDQQFIDLYWKLVKSGHIDGGIYYNTFKGVPQGGIVSPVLSNIYLNEFDSFIQKIRLPSIEDMSKDKIKVSPLMEKSSKKFAVLRDEYQRAYVKNQDPGIRQLRVIPGRDPERKKIPSIIRTPFPSPPSGGGASKNTWRI